MAFRDHYGDLRQDFIEGWILQSVIRSSFARNPTYTKNPTSQKKKEFKERMEEEIRKILTRYSTKKGQNHTNTIEKFANTLDKEFSDILKGHFKIGRAQKIINLYLKYQWIIGKMEQPPPHCPFDGVIINRLKQNSKNSGLKHWTTITKIEEYKELLKAAKNDFWPGENFAHWKMRVYQEEIKKNSS